MNALPFTTPVVGFVSVERPNIVVLSDTVNFVINPITSL